MTMRGLRSLAFLLPLALLLAAVARPAVTRVGVEEGLRIALLAVRALIVPMVLGGTVLRLLSSSRRAAVLPYALGLLCGFPTGAQLVSELYQSGRITKERAERLLFFCNNCSLPFLLAFLGRTGLFLFLLQLLLTLPFLLFSLRTSEAALPCPRETPPFSVALTESLRRTGETMIYVCCCILFFTFLGHWVESLLKAALPIGCALRLCFELTGGILQAGHSLPLIAAGVGFGGLSVHMQTAGLLSKAGLSCRKHLIGKLLLGLMMGVSSYFLQKVL